MSLPALVSVALRESAHVSIVAAHQLEASLRAVRPVHDTHALRRASDRATCDLHDAIAVAPLASTDRGDVEAIARGLHESTDAVVDAVALAGFLQPGDAPRDLLQALAAVVRDAAQALSDAVSALHDEGRLQRLSVRARDLCREADALERQTVFRAMAGDDPLTADVTRRWTGAARLAVERCGRPVGRLQVVQRGAARQR